MYLHLLSPKVLTGLKLKIFGSKTFLLLAKIFSY